MAPTVCNEKKVCLGGAEIHKTVTLHRKRSRSILNGNNTGKIAHRRSIAVRCATSKLSAREMNYSETSSSEDSETESYSGLNDLNQRKLTSSPKSNTNHTNTNDSEIEVDCSCSERLTTSSTGTTDSAYDNSHCRYCIRSNRLLLSSDDSVSANGHFPITNDIVVFYHEGNDMNGDPASSLSAYSPWEDSSDYCRSEKLEMKCFSGRRQQKNTKGLLEIAVKTVKLIKRNQLLQKKLAQLQFETRRFIESVMANPENRDNYLPIGDRAEVEALSL